MAVPVNMNLISMLIASVFIISLTACDESDSPKISVVVSILPQKYFVERIGGSHVDVDVMVQPGASPATFEPFARSVAQT